jgi:translation initiation factor IF-2
MTTTTDKIIPRPPVVVVMGHIDHGKSTLLDYIRKTNIVDKEAGGITQHISAYEVTHTDKNSAERRITFLDTPGHEAFKSIRTRGARVADVAILVVAAEDGVKPQTLEALEVIRKDKLPFVVAINKIDKSDANLDKTKQNLAENDIFLEGYGGDVPWAAVSAKTGVGVSDLLDLLLLAADLEELTGDPGAVVEGVIIESHLDSKKGITATTIITNGTITKGLFAVSGGSFAPLRILEDFRGKPVSSATFSSPIRIIGWSNMPVVGEKLTVVKTKKEALEISEKFNADVTPAQQPANMEATSETGELKAVVPIIIKADTAGSLDALIYEIEKLGNERVIPKVVLSGLGFISENDIRTASTKEDSLVISFHTSVDPKAASLALRMGIEIYSFDIIYKFTEWLEETMNDRTPKVEMEETTGVAKILKLFSQNKSKQVVGGRVESGTISVGDNVKLMRQETEIAHGKIRELQQAKQKTSSVAEGSEFGSLIESKFEIAPGDRIESFHMVNK